MDRLIRMLLRMVMRRGFRRLASRGGGKPNPQARQAQRAVRNVNRIGRM